MKMKRVLLFLVLAALLCSAAWSQSPALSLKEVAAQVLAHDPNVSSSQQTAQLALHNYNGTIAQSLPQIDLKGSYGLAYTPFETLSSGAQTIEAHDQTAHSIGASLSLSQLLPTGGNAFLNIGDTMSAITLGSLDTTIGGFTTTTNPGTEFSQSPSLTLGITQPILLNGKLLDMELFPSIKRKAEIGWQKADAQSRLQTNQILTQTAQLFLTVVQLRKNLAQSEASLQVAQGNLENLQRNLSLGLVSESDLLDAKIGVSSKKQAILEMRSSLSKTELTLAHGMGLESLSGVALSDQVPALSIEGSRDELVGAALSASPAIIQQILSAEEKRVDDILAGQKYASTLSLSFSYSPRYPFDATPPYTTTDFGHSFSDLYGTGSGTDWSFSAGVTIHLFDGGQARETHAANTSLATVGQNSLTSQRQSIQDQLDLDLQSMENLKEKTALLSDSVELASLKLDTEQNLLSLGKSTQLGVDSKRADRDARINDLWRARADLLLVTMDIASLTGKDISSLIQGSVQ